MAQTDFILAGIVWFALAVVLPAVGGPVTAMAAEHWQPVPLVRQSTLDAGTKVGGEGGQWPQAICMDSTDGTFLLFGTDVGGIFRSTNGGQFWEPCNIGYNPRGNCGFAIDPNNSNRALAVGANSLEMDCHGIYLTTDQGASWTHVLPKKTKGYRDFRDQVVYDKASYDAAAGFSKVAYWTIDRLYKTTDGGKTWSEIANSGAYGNGFVKIHPTKGYVYIANDGGLFKSTNGGVSFAQKAKGPVTGLDVVASQPDSVFACTPDRVLVSTDAGETFSTLTPSGLGGKLDLKKIHASPVNPKRMLLENHEGSYQHRKCYSMDGGKTWARSKEDSSQAFLPYNNRQPMFAWHPKDEKIAWSFGGDWIGKSVDGGVTWIWAGSGDTGIMTGEHFNFNTQNPDILYLPSQDYNGGVTTNGGATWTYINISQESWGGSAYGGYAATSQIIFAGSGGWNGPRHLKITRDGGKTVVNTGISLGGAGVSYGDPTDPNILFCFNHRSADQGLHWAPMKGCDGVFTSNPKGERELFGRNGSSLVRSTDKGATWTALKALPAEISDVAYDHMHNRVYAAAGDKLFQYDIASAGLAEITGRFPPDQFGGRRVGTVAVDPVDPSVVYAGGARNVYSTDTSVVRSTDAGQTWQALTRSTRLNNPQFGTDGGREAIAIRVHPKTRYAYVGTGCYGFWKIGPPGGGNGDNGIANKAPASEPKAAPVDLKVAP